MRTIEWKEGVVKLLDQTKLPHVVEYVETRDYKDLIRAIKNMQVRGAPLIGVTAAFGLALVAYHSKAERREELIKELEKVSNEFKATRPTGRNLYWTLSKIMDVVRRMEGDTEELRRRVIDEANKIAEEDVKTNLLIGRYGSKLIEDGDVILTHCNTGLGTVEHGTAFAIIKTAHEEGKQISVIATETRPLLQGSRLTAWELKQAGIPFKLITDNMVGFVMYRKMVSKVVVGADRVTKEGHVVNKVGTYTIAVLAKEHNIPFYVASPLSTVDLESSIADVEIEYRKPEEVTTIYGESIAPEGTDVLNPAFDITPPEYVTAIVTERGIAYKPFEDSLKELVSRG